MPDLFKYHFFIRNSPHYNSIMKGYPWAVYAAVGFFIAVVVVQRWLLEVPQLDAGFGDVAGLGNLKESSEENSSLKLQINKLAAQVTKQSEEIQELRQEIRSVVGDLREAVEFLPLKDPTVLPMEEPDRTWFLSSVRQDRKEGIAEHFVFPSEISQGKVLCVAGRDPSNGTRNSYAFASPKYLPLNSTLLTGITFIADQFYDYGNPWHSMTTLILALSWSLENACEAPDRFLLYHKGELVYRMGSYISTILAASFGRASVVPDLIPDAEKGPVCFKKALVYRRGLGRLSINKRIQLFDAVRCKVRRFCDVLKSQRSAETAVNVTLVARRGPRSFKNESAVADIVGRECSKVKGCKFRVAHIANLTFCDQVRVMTETDVMVTAHGAQLTNMMFMSKGSNIMEMYPKGWLEGAGVGQYIYQWFASWTGMVHQGAYRDTEGPDCPNLKEGSIPCFVFHKDRQVGHNETFLSQWTSQVIHKFLNQSSADPAAGAEASAKCPCNRRR